MIHFSQFTKLFTETKGQPALRNAIRREAIARYTERLNSGHADSELNFRDLADRLLEIA